MTDSITASNGPPCHFLRIPTGLISTLIRLSQSTDLHSRNTPPDLSLPPPRTHVFLPRAFKDSGNSSPPPSNPPNKSPNLLRSKRHSLRGALRLTRQSIADT